MNRRGFLSALFKGTVAVAAAPQIITHGLALVKPKLIVAPTAFWFETARVSRCYTQAYLDEITRQMDSANGFARRILETGRDQISC